MENIQARVAKVREALGKSQDDFGTALGVTKSTISLIETKKRDPSERFVRDVCREFNVNEDWLRSGTGGDKNMFIPEDMRYYYNLGKMKNEKNEFKKFYLSSMMNLPDEYWDYIYNEFMKFKEKNKEQP